jgi:Zn finger protein HypA/HybF involved in hydrogenase expression
MSEIFWGHARKCHACASHKYSIFQSADMVVMECKSCQHRRPLRCPMCQGETFEVREKRDSLDRPYRRPFCRACDYTHTSWNLRLTVDA